MTNLDEELDKIFRVINAENTMLQSQYDRHGNKHQNLTWSAHHFVPNPEKYNKNMVSKLIGDIICHN